jgi:membrane protease YdiL (CAAX protease family)
MNGLPEHEPDQDLSSAEDSGAHAPEAGPAEPSQPEASEELPGPLPASSDLSPSPSPAAEDAELPPALREAGPLLFQSWFEPESAVPERIPHLGHLGILAVLAFLGLVATSLLTRCALHFHLFGVTTVQQAIADIHYTLGSEAVLYLFIFAGCLLLFPLVWHKSFFAGLQWNGATALRLRRRLFNTALFCFGLALLNGLLLPGPSDTPIDKIFRAPGAAWMLFVFGVTFAPFFEELFFRGFLLPALATAWDWSIEQSTGAAPRPLDETGQPQWSFFAMAVATIVTSIPFALMHAAQTGYSLGPFLLLVCVSLILCWTRLSTRSLAASVLVHAAYNFLLFSLMLFGTGGFRHLEKM